MLRAYFFASCSLKISWAECWYVTHVIEWGVSTKISHICKMGLTDLHDFYDSWHLYIRRFVASLVFMKRTSCCVIRRIFRWSLAVLPCLSKFVKGHRSAWSPLLSACRLLEFDTSLICHVFMHCLLIMSFLVAIYGFADQPVFNYETQVFHSFVRLCSIIQGPQHMEQEINSLFW